MRIVDVRTHQLQCKIERPLPMPRMLEFEQTENPFRDHLASASIVQVGGVVAIPDRPGLGIEIDRAVIERFAA